MDRRGFLRLGGTGLAGAILLGTASGESGRALAQIRPSLAAEFEAAAREYGVPKELLLAVGYVNTLWEMPPPDASPTISTGAAPTASCNSCGAPRRTPWDVPLR